jgi:hypothetical protein
MLPTCAACHCCVDGHNPAVPLSLSNQSICKVVGVGASLGWGTLLLHAGAGVKLDHAVHLVLQAQVTSRK